ncbi:hypothetical protein CYMTET_10618, partial [Cymbomonas tetramitiformis]
VDGLRNRQTGGTALSPRQTWVLDSMPGLVEGDAHMAEQTLAALRTLPQPVPSRKWLQEYMAPRGFSDVLINWIGTNLVPQPGSKPGVGPLVWGFSIEGCADMYNSYSSTCMWDVIKGTSTNTPVDLVRAEKCIPWDVEGEENLAEALSQNSEAFRAHVLPKAGHWVQMDNPTGLVEIMKPSFLRLCT